MYVFVGEDREQARALKRAIDAHRPEGFKSATTRVATDALVKKLGLHKLPALVYFGDYPDETSNFQVICQGSADPSHNQLATIDSRLQAIEDFIATQRPKVLPRDQACITGTVTEQGTGEPVYLADISYEFVRTSRRYAQRGGAATDLDGRFTLPTIAEGLITLTVSMRGYRSSEHQLVAKGTGADLEIRLEPKEGEIRPKRVRGEFSGILRLQFEGNRFIPDEKTAFRCFDPLQEIDCWVELTPEVTGVYESNVNYEIICEGVLHGPGAYGHMSMSSHYLWIERIRKSMPTDK